MKPKTEVEECYDIGIKALLKEIRRIQSILGSSTGIETKSDRIEKQEARRQLISILGDHVKRFEKPQFIKITLKKGETHSHNPIIRAAMSGEISLQQMERLLSAEHKAIEIQASLASKRLYEKQLNNED